jgi:hypothetical protein
MIVPFYNSVLNVALVLPLLTLYSSKVVLLVECYSNHVGIRAMTRSTSMVRLDATVDISPATLIPPSEINTDETASLFEERIQKTYG